MSSVIQAPSITAARLLKEFPPLFTEILGDPERVFSGVSSPEHGTADKILFLATPKALAQGLLSKAGVLVVGKKARDEAEAKRDGRTVLISPSPELAMAAVVNRFFLATPYTNRSQTGRHPTAVIAGTAELAPDVRVGPNAFIGEHVKIAAGCYIGANSVIEDDTQIGANTVIHPLVFIGHSTLIGERCEVHPNSTVAKEGYGYAHDERFNHYKIPHIGRVVLENDVHIGSGCTIDRATLDETRLCAGARLDNQVHMAHNVRLGRNSLLTAGFSVAGSTTIGANFVAGGRAVATGHVNVCDNVQISALSAISKDITEPGQYGGSPLVPLQQHIKIKAALANLPELRQTVRKIAKAMGIS